MKQMSWAERGIRVLLLLAGLTVAHLGVTLFLESNLGADPFNVLVQGIFRVLGGVDDPWEGSSTGLPVHHSGSSCGCQKLCAYWYSAVHGAGRADY